MKSTFFNHHFHPPISPEARQFFSISKSWIGPQGFSDPDSDRKACGTGSTATAIEKGRRRSVGRKIKKPFRDEKRFFIFASYRHRSNIMRFKMSYWCVKYRRTIFDDVRSYHCILYSMFMSYCVMLCHVLFCHTINCIEHCLLWYCTRFHYVELQCTQFQTFYCISFVFCIYIYIYVKVQ